jgi:hypothetical protein
VTVHAWLHARLPTPPPALIARVESALGDRCDHDAADAAELCLAAAEDLLRDLTARASTGRESALDLLSVDALVTYAFEAASTSGSASPAELSRRASDAMRRLASTVAA